MYTYRTQGVCSRTIGIELSEDGKSIEEVQFVGGCDGNLKGISKLVKGMPVDKVCDLLEGNTCGFKSTSCPDQLVHGLREAQAAMGVK